MNNNHLYLIRFEAHLMTERRIATNTLHAYKKDCQQLLDFLNKKQITLEQVAFSDLQAFLKELHSERIKARTIARKISSIKSFFGYLHEQHGFEDNVAEQLLTPKLEQVLPQYLSEKEVQDVLSVANQDISDLGVRNKTMLYLLYGSGLRVSELIQVRLSDLDFYENTLKIHGKGSKQRMVPLNDVVLGEIKSYIQQVHPRLTMVKNKRVETDYLFPTCYGGKIKPLTRQLFWGVVKKLCVQAGIKRPVSPHQLRHSLATHLLTKGANLRSLQVLLGHEKVDTVQIYTHLETSALRSIYDKKHPRSE